MAHVKLRDVSESLNLGDTAVDGRDEDAAQKELSDRHGTGATGDILDSMCG